MTETATAPPPQAQTAGPAARESILGAKVTLSWLVGFLIAAIVGTTAAIGFIDGRMGEKVAAVREEIKGVRDDMKDIRTDMKDGFRELRSEVRAITDKKGN